MLLHYKIFLKDAKNVFTKEITFNKVKTKSLEGFISSARREESCHFYTPMIHSEHDVRNNIGPKNN